MGSQIAAHFSNAGIPTLLLDLTRDAARDGLNRARALKPDPFFTADVASLIELGGFDTDLGRLSGLDLIVEAVTELVEIKRALLARVDDVRKGETIVSSNTSGIPIAALAEGRSDGFRSSLARHALLQSAEVSASPRNHSDAGNQSVCRRADITLRGCAARQGRSGCEGPAELHRESHRDLLGDSNPEASSSRATTRSRTSMP